MTKLIAVKIIHTSIWIFFNVVIMYLSYAVIVNKVDVLVWLSIAIMILEGFVLLSFRGTCPLTLMARKYTTSTKANFDIYLPEWLARYNKLIYTSLFVMIVGVLIYR